MSWSNIDDGDPRIKYTGSWTNIMDTSGHYSYTLTNTIRAGDTATLNFTDIRVGTKIFVFGSIFANNVILFNEPTVDPVSNYTIDSGIPYQYTGRRQASEQFEENFFGVSNLTASPHTLVITNIADNGWLALDYFEVLGDIAESTTASLASSTTFTPSSSTASAAMVTVTAQVSGKHTNPVVGAPIGGAIAGFAVVCLMFYFLLSRRRRQKNALHLPTSQSTAHSYSEIASTQRQGPSNITPFDAGEPSHNTLPPSYPEIPPAQQRQNPSNITPFVVGEPSHQPSTRPSQSNAKQERTANENGSNPAPEGVVAPSYTKNPVAAGERLPLFYLEPSTGAQQQRPSNITPFIIEEPSQPPLAEPSQPNAGGRAKQGNNSNENGGSPAPEEGGVPSNTNAALPAGERQASAGERQVSVGERRVSDGERQEVAELPPAYTVLPDVG